MAYVPLRPEDADIADFVYMSSRHAYVTHPLFAAIFFLGDCGSQGNRKVNGCGLSDVASQSGICSTYRNQGNTTLLV